MEIILKLSREDYIQYYLWSAFEFGEFESKKKKSIRQFLVAFLVLAAFFLFFGAYTMASIYLVVGILLYFFYPIRLRKLYVKHYNRFVDTKLKDQIGEEVKVVLAEDGIKTFDISGESHLHWSALNSAYFLEEYVYLVLNANQGLILPKSDIPSLDELKSLLESKGVEIH